MVKRAGGSKACLTCLKRRKACDLQKPACGQCRKLNRECEGYTRPLVFRNTVIQSKQKQTPTKPAKCDSKILLHDGLSQSAFFQQITGLYWKAYLPNGQNLPADVSVLEGWIEAIHILEQQVQVIHKALLALSLATLGRVDAQEWMTKEGQRLYGDVLSDTSALIDARKKNLLCGRRKLELITTVRLLSFFEAMQLKNGTDKMAQANNWMTHNTGEASLLLSNSPSFYASGLAHRLFVDGRMHLAFAAMRAGKASFLSESTWKTIPWTYHSKTPRDLLVDTALDLPGLYEYVDRLPHLPGSLLIAQYEETINMCLELHRQLNEWKDTYYACFEEELKSELAGAFTTRSISSKTIMAAHMTSFYWSLALKVNSTLHDLDPSDSYLPAGSIADMCCQNAVRIIPILLKPAMGMFRVHLATFPLGAAVTHVARVRSEELHDARNALATYLALPQCASMRQLIRSLQPENTDYVLSCEVSPPSVESLWLTHNLTIRGNTRARSQGTTKSQNQVVV